eukprot:TRINITY_DN9009_c0_g1_i2.p1 TRINITY_DN9009_c0_g1~~TRINITY_DN9009_c0_g1_i2.p1  ORF type:complete len:1299 (+),score=407.21 TRINITY_DN9009_c0_g1_i2:357-3899(+)
MADANEEELKEWEQLAGVWNQLQEDLAQVAKPLNPTSSGDATIPSFGVGSMWEAIVKEARPIEASHAEVGQSRLSLQIAVDPEGRKSMLVEAARRAAAFDEQLQEQKARLKKRRKAEAKDKDGDIDPQLTVCKNLAEMSVLEDLKQERSLAAAQCLQQAQAAEGSEKEAWEQLQTFWDQHHKDLTKVETDVNASTASAAERSGGVWSQMARLSQSDDGTSRKAALFEASRRIAAFDEELQKQRHLMHKRQKRQGERGAEIAPLVAGQALIDGQELQKLLQEYDEGSKVCEDALRKACDSNKDASAWEDLRNMWAKLRTSLGKAEKEVAASELRAERLDFLGPEATRADHLADSKYAEVATAARRAANFERKLHDFHEQLRQSPADAENPRRHPLLADAYLQNQQEALRKLQEEHEQEAATCQKLSSSSKQPEAAEAWKELVALWDELGEDIRGLEKDISTLNEVGSSADLGRSKSSVGVSDSERRAALQEAARQVALFDEELQQQRQKLQRRRRQPNTSASGTATSTAPDTLLEHGEKLEAAATLKELERKQVEAIATIKQKLATAEPDAEPVEMESWHKILQIWDSFGGDLKETAGAAGIGIQGTQAGQVAALSPAELEELKLSHAVVEQIAKAQKKSLQDCLQSMNEAICSDAGPSWTEPASTMNTKGSNRTDADPRPQQKTPNPQDSVQTWDVLEEAQELLDKLARRDNASSKKALAVLESQSRAAEAQLMTISEVHGGDCAKEAVKKQIGPEQHDIGCQAGSTLGCLSPAVEELHHSLDSALGVRRNASAPEELDQLGAEIADIIQQWRQNFQSVPAAGKSDSNKSRSPLPALQTSKASGHVGGVLMPAQPNLAKAAPGEEGKNNAATVGKQQPQPSLKAKPDTVSIKAVKEIEAVATSENRRPRSVAASLDPVVAALEKASQEKLASNSRASVNFDPADCQNLDRAAAGEVAARLLEANVENKEQKDSEARNGSHHRPRSNRRERKPEETIPDLPSKRITPETPSPPPAPPKLPDDRAHIAPKASVPCDCLDDLSQLPNQQPSKSRPSSAIKPSRPSSASELFAEGHQAPQVPHLKAARPSTAAANRTTKVEELPAEFQVSREDNSRASSMERKQQQGTRLDPMEKRRGPPLPSAARMLLSTAPAVGRSDSMGAAGSRSATPSPGGQRSRNPALQ